MCSAGTCAASCASPLSACGGVCRDTRVDPSNCGGCGVVCAAGTACVASACTAVCPTGQLLCGGACISATASSCGAPVDLGSVVTGAVVMTPVSYLPVASQEAWYVVAFPAMTDFSTHSPGAPRVTFATNVGGIFRLEVHVGSCGGATTCAGPLQNTDWNFVDNASPPPGYYSRAVGWPTTVFIRVIRTTTGTSCNSYSLRISR